jgi:hypothetical protein
MKSLGNGIVDMKNAMKKKIVVAALAVTTLAVSASTVQVARADNPVTPTKTGTRQK